MTPSLISAMTTAEAVAAMLDADRLSELLQRPVRAARLRMASGMAPCPGKITLSAAITSSGREVR